MKLQRKNVKESPGDLGYNNMLAVMHAADTGQPAAIELGGEPITLEYQEARFLSGRYKAFLRAGRQEEFLKYMSNPVAFDHLMKQLRDLIDKQKNFRGSIPGERGVPEAVTEVVSEPKKIIKQVTVKPIGESLKENEYYCKIDRIAKPIPTGYKKVANGYIMRK